MPFLICVKSFTPKSTIVRSVLLLIYFFHILNTCQPVGKRPLDAVLMVDLVDRYLKINPINRRIVLRKKRNSRNRVLMMIE